MSLVYHFSARLHSVIYKLPNWLLSSFSAAFASASRLLPAEASASPTPSSDTRIVNTGACDCPLRLTNRYSGSLDGREFVVLGELAHNHHRGEQCCQRQCQRQDRAPSPHEEFAHDTQTQALADKLVDVEPEKLHHQYEYDD